MVSNLSDKILVVNFVKKDLSERGIREQYSILLFQARSSVSWIVCFYLVERTLRDLFLRNPQNVSH